MKEKFKRFLAQLVRFNNHIQDDHITAFASEAALFTIISFLPFVMLFLTILSFTPLNSDFFIRLIGDSMPDDVILFIENIVSDVFSPSNTVISISAVSALWAASRGFFSLFRGFNVIYKTGETRKSLILRFFSILYTLGFAVLLLLTLVLLVFGNNIYKWIVGVIPWIKDIALLIISVRATVIMFLLFIYFLIMYIVIPNRKTTLLNELPGAILSSAGWVFFSYAYAYYIDNISNFYSMYGSLTAIVFLMLWMYFCMYILFIGAEVNVHFGKKVAERFMKNRKDIKKKKRIAKLHSKDGNAKRTTLKKNIKVRLKAAKKTGRFKRLVILGENAKAFSASISAISNELAEEEGEDKIKKKEA